MDQEDGSDENGELDEGGEARVQSHGEECPPNQVSGRHVDREPREAESRLRGSQQLLQSALRGQQGEAAEE